MSKGQPQLLNQAVNPEKNRHIFSVAEISRDIKLILENTFGEVWVEGEVSNFKAHPSGHFYFSLKDEAAVLSAVMFIRENRGVRFKIENGLRVICFGRIATYEPYSQYQIIVQTIEPKGIGSLQLALEQLKRKLEKEGLFSSEHKRPMPFLPSRIAVVTSLSGAAIKDILKVLERRFSDIHIIINSVKVQGEGAKESIAEAIKDFNLFNERLPLRERIEVMIVGRGGGSTEDLWAFNEEMVARAIYNSQIPVISAVGHERDITIADLVADMRAATPSVAAEIVVPRKEDLKNELFKLDEDLKRAGQEVLASSTEDFKNAYKNLLLLNPSAMLKRSAEKIAEFAAQLSLRMGHFLTLKKAEFNAALEKLSSLSPLNILGRGYSITFRMPAGEIVKDAGTVKVGSVIKTRLHKGTIVSQVKETSING